MFEKIKSFFKPATPKQEETDAKYAEQKDEFEIEITEIDRKIAEKILNQVQIEGDKYKSKKLTPEIIRENQLVPKYKIKVGDISVWFSSQTYDIGKGRIAVMAYVKKEDKVIARSYYRSNSQGVWRFLPDYETDNQGKIILYGKGYHEQSIVLPIAMQKAMEEIAQKKPALEIKNEDPQLLLAGTAKHFSWDEKSKYYQEIESSPRKLDGNFYATSSKKRLAPESLHFNNPEDKPDFFKILTSWTAKSSLYGDISMEVFSSQNKAFKYVFCRDKKNRVWISAIEDNSEIQSSGLKKNWVLGGDLTTPAYEYNIQAGSYGNANDMKGKYCDMYEKYISKIPIIKEYLEQLNSRPNQESSQAKSAQISAAQNFEELAAILRSLKVVKGTRDNFTAGDLNKIIFDIRKGQAKLENLPRAEGLRDKVEELLKKEPRDISQVKNFQDLFFLLDKMGEIKGSQKNYPAHELRRLINEYLQGKKTIDYITGVQGLRDKVEELAKELKR